MSDAVKHRPKGAKAGSRRAAKTAPVSNSSSIAGPAPSSPSTSRKVPPVPPPPAKPKTRALKSSAEQKEPTQPARSRKKLSKKGPVDKAKGSGKQTFECADLEILGRIVRWIRKNRKGKATMTQVELAQRMSEISGRPVDQATVSRIESGDRAMSLPTFNALSQAVEIPGNCLLMLAIKEFGEDEKLENLIREVQNEVSRKYLGLSYVPLLQDLPPVKK